MTEAEMQDRLALFVSQQSDLLMVPNVGALGTGVRDLLRVTKDGRVWEYEIKISKADYRRDTGKLAHVYMQSAWQKLGDLFSEPVRTKGVGKGYLFCPHRFYYAVPEGLLEGEEVPEYAGIIEVGQFVQQVRPAKLLHEESTPKRTLHYLMRGQRLRYWQSRRDLADSKLRNQLLRAEATSDV